MIEVINPTGAISVNQPFAPRLTGLEGKKIAVLSNDDWQAHRTLPRVQELLEKRFPSTKFVAFVGKHKIQQDEMIALVLDSGCDAVIVGNAA